MSKEKKEKTVDQEMIDQLKTRHSDGIYEGEISFNDAEEKLHSVNFIYRKPTTADIEFHAKTSQKNPIIANLNLVQSLIVHPEPGPVIETIREYPAAYGRFVDEAISPFFGANVSIKSKRL
ncbi:MAG: hypothetical protein LBU66_03195 [Treponema sp.]|jgi:hypothetical protein|nr:hypothetical protein [Treponema sp.]